MLQIAVCNRNSRGIGKKPNKYKFVIPEKYN